VSVAIKKIDGVESVSVSLNQGRASIRLKPGNSVRLEQVDQAVQNNGFTPKEARVKVRGQVSVTDGKPKFKVLGANEVYGLVIDSQHAKLSGEIAKQAGKEVVIEGAVPAPSKGNSQNVIHVLRFEAEKVE
jgi:copper chaperone CopZ